jgi:hypothetical protein
MTSMSRRQVLAAGGGLGAALMFGGRPASAATEWNLNERYGVTQAGIAAAISDAKEYFRRCPHATLVLRIAPGRYHLNNDNGSTLGIIDISDVRPGPGGRLIIRGGGQDGKRATTLVFDGTIDNIYGTNVYQVTFEGIHMTQAKLKVSQGTVVSVAPGAVVLDIARGFPSPQDIFSPTLGQGRYLRAYDNSDPLNPKIIDNESSPSLTNFQIPWNTATPDPLRPDRWQINLKNPGQVAGYQPGDQIGIKSKHGGNAYWFGVGSDFVFHDVMWTGETRGVWRHGFDNIRISKCTIRRADPIHGQTPFLASPGGGPQLGQPNDPPLRNVLVEYCHFVGPGDDVVAFFNAAGVVRRSYFSDSFARFLLLNSPDVRYEHLGNKIVRMPVVIL